MFSTIKKFYPRIYNMQQSLALADEKLRSFNKSAILKELGLIILKYGLEDLIGVRLLHKHNPINDEEIMLEREEIHSGVRYLSTVATSNSYSLSEFCPNSWKLNEDKYFPLEYSTDMVVSLNTSSKKSVLPTFFQAFAETLKSIKVEDLLGPCILPRKFYLHYNLDEDGMLIETTDYARRANLVRYATAQEQASLKLVEATWVFKRFESKASSGCLGYCSASCEVHSACVTDNDGIHSSESNHASYHSSTAHP